MTSGVLLQLSSQFPRTKTISRIRVRVYLVQSHTLPIIVCSCMQTYFRMQVKNNAIYTFSVALWFNYHVSNIYVTCSNEMSRMSANLISRKHRINMQRWISTILTFCHQSILWYLFCQLAMLISRLYYYLVHFIAFLDRLRNISSMNFVKTEPINRTSSCRILWGFPQRMVDLFGATGKPWTPSFGFL